MREPFPKTTYIELSALLKKVKSKKLSFLLRTSQVLKREDVITIQSRGNYKDNEKLAGFLDASVN